MNKTVQNLLQNSPTGWISRKKIIFENFRMAIGKLMSVIAEEDTVTGFLLGGIGELDKERQSNFLVRPIIISPKAYMSIQNFFYFIALFSNSGPCSGAPPFGTEVASSSAKLTTLVDFTREYKLWTVYPIELCFFWEYKPRTHLKNDPSLTLNDLNFRSVIQKRSHMMWKKL